VGTLWETILTTALLTPSPHNTQPWRVRIEDDRHAILFMERARTLPDEDITGHFLRCAMGMFIESVRIIAANAGWTLRSILINDCAAQPLIRFASLDLEPGCQPSIYPDHLFRQRMTSRLPSNGMRIDPRLSVSLRQFEPEQEQRYHQCDDPILIEALIQENITAVFHDLNVPAYHDEIAQWFRYSDDEARRKADGLDYRCMRTKPIELRLMRRVPQLMRWPLTRQLIRGRYRQQIGAVSHVGIISGPFFDDKTAVKAGGFLMRFWLELARHNLQIHPFGNLVTNPSANDRVRALTNINNIWLVFRVGYTDQPPRSYRRPLDEVLIHD
jgi:hypothetical protein